jgi:hypothetical protein
MEIRPQQALVRTMCEILLYTIVGAMIGYWSWLLLTIVVELTPGWVWLLLVSPLIYYLLTIPMI